MPDKVKPGTAAAERGLRGLDPGPQISPTHTADGICTQAEALRKLPIADIKFGRRHRRDLGDVGRLAAGIKCVGLMHPPVVTRDGTLIVGERRIKSCMALGWKSVPVTVVALDEIVRGEAAENFERKVGAATMNGMNHPSALMAEAKRERVVVDTAEAQALQEAIFRAVDTYRDYLDRHGLLFDADRELMVASGLLVTCDFNGEMEVFLKDGPIDRLYCDGTDPDPFGTPCPVM